MKKILFVLLILFYTGLWAQTPYTNFDSLNVKKGMTVVNGKFAILHGNSLSASDSDNVVYNRNHFYGATRFDSVLSVGGTINGYTLSQGSSLSDTTKQLLKSDSSSTPNGAKYLTATMGIAKFAPISTVSSQWVTSGSNISYTAGNVGIGTTSLATTRLGIKNGLLLNATEWYNSSAIDIAHLDSIGALFTKAGLTITNTGLSANLLTLNNKNGTPYIVGDSTGDFKYKLKHAVASADSISYSLGRMAGTYYSIETGALIVKEAKGITVTGDSIQIPTAGDYEIIVHIAPSTSNSSDRMRIRMTVNGAWFSPQLSRWIILSNGSTTNIQTYEHYWYLLSIPANAWLSFWVDNLIENRAVYITDFGFTIKKIPE